MIEGLKPAYNALLKPVAQFLLKMKIHPNHITFLSFLLFIGAAWLTAQGFWKYACAAIVAASLLDGLDGVLARIGNLSSTFGAIFDSSCDRLAEIAWFGGLGWFYFKHYAPSQSFLPCALIFFALTGSLMISYIKARCEGAGLACNNGILQRPERLIIIALALLLGPKIMMFALWFLAIVGYLTVLQRFDVAYRHAKLKDLHS